MSDDPPSGLEAVAEEFIERRRRGEKPSISEYARAHPALADGIREAFPALCALEKARGQETPSPVGQTLGDYELIREIGRGGMGVVFEAIQRTLARRVAIKLLPAQARLDTRYLQRFRQEATAAARLQHPNIVPVIGLGQHEDVHYFAMHYVEGHGLDAVVDSLATARSSDDPSGAFSDLFTRDLSASGFLQQDATGLRANVLPGSIRRPKLHRYFQNVARMSLQVADGLAYAHAQGVLHRDVKPANLMMDEQGKMWITDFGLCKDESADGLTQSGDVIGTLRYMPPERLNGQSDVRGDVYGLGITMYELLTRSQVFDGQSRTELLQSVLKDEPRRPRALDATIPLDLESIVRKAMAKDPERRYATAEALASDLRNYLTGHPIQARPLTATYVLRTALRRHKGLVLAALAVGALLITGSVFYVLNLREKERVARRRQYVATISAAETAVRDGDALRLKRMLSEAPEEHRGFEWHLFHAHLEESARAFPSTGAFVSCLAYRPDGTQVLVAAGKAVQLLDTATGVSLRTLAHSGRMRAAAWSPDGTGIATAVWGRDEILVWGEADTPTLRITAHDVTDIAWGGAHIVATSTDHTARVFEAATGDTVHTLSVGSRALCVDVSPKGTHALCGTWDGRVGLWDLSDGTEVWSQAVGRGGVRDACFVGPDRVAATSGGWSVAILSRRDGRLEKTLPGRSPTWLASNPSGTHLAASDAFVVGVWNVELGRREQHIRGQGRDVSCVSFSGEGRRLLVGTVAGTVEEWDAWPTNPDVLLGHMDDVSEVAFHPNGRWLVAGGAGPVVTIWDLEARELARTWIGSDVWQQPFHLSPDGAYVLVGDHSFDLTLWDFATGTVVRQFKGHTAPISDAAFLGDGTRLVSASHDGTLGIWDTATGNRLASLPCGEGGARSLGVSGNGRRIAAGGQDGVLRLWDARTLRPIQSLSGHTNRIGALAIDERGKRVVTVAYDKTMRLWNVDQRTSVMFAHSDPDLSWMSETLASLAFSPDGTRIASGARNGTVQLWTPEGDMVCSMGGHAGWVGDVVFAPDGRSLCSCAGGGRIRLWDTRSMRGRAPAIRAANAIRERARPIFDAAYEATTTIDDAIERLQDQPGLDDDVHEAALRLAHQRRLTVDELIRRTWSDLAEATPDPERLALARATTQALWRASGHQNRQIDAAATLHGIAAFRADKLKSARRYLERGASMHARRRPDLLAADLAFLVQVYVTLDEQDAAQDAFTRLEALRSEHPDARSLRLDGFYEVARATLGR